MQGVGVGRASRARRARRLARREQSGHAVSAPVSGGANPLDGSGARSGLMGGFFGRSEKPALKVGDVFVVGKLPRVTYNPRANLRLEDQIQEYLEDRGTILSVSGPTKTGKTVLLKRVIDDAFWLTGGSLHSLEDFWRQLADVMGLASETSDNRTWTDGESRTKEGSATVGVASGKYSGASTTASSYGAGSRSVRDTSNNARSALRGSAYVLVIDDFHYIDQAVQLGIVRGLKDLVFDGLGVILASVPHRAYDAVRVEKEMTGRVTHLQIDPWSRDELLTISDRGFEALGVFDEDSRLGGRLADESFGSPFLMQDFCRRLCRDQGVHETKSSRFRLAPPPDWKPFFERTAADASKTAFDLLARGPRQRRDRRARLLKDGRKVDIYGAILAAIANTGPRLSIEYETLRSSLREVLASELPQRHEVTRVLDQMTQIAKEKIDGEPVVDYDDSLSTLHISDPYFAFYLRWGRVSVVSSLVPSGESF